MYVFTKVDDSTLNLKPARPSADVNAAGREKNCSAGNDHKAFDNDACCTPPLPRRHAPAPFTVSIFSDKSV